MLSPHTALFTASMLSPLRVRVNPPTVTPQERYSTTRDQVGTITSPAHRVGLDWTGLDWIGLDWTGLDWIGLDWIGLDMEDNSSPWWVTDKRAVQRMGDLNMKHASERTQRFNSRLHRVLVLVLPLMVTVAVAVTVAGSGCEKSADLECGVCHGATEWCNPSGECVDDCIDRDCGLSPNAGLSCGTCTAPGEMCDAQGHCAVDPESLTWVTILKEKVSALIASKRCD